MSTLLRRQHAAGTIGAVKHLQSQHTCISQCASCAAKWLPLAWGGGFKPLPQVGQHAATGRKFCMQPKLGDVLTDHNRSQLITTDHGILMCWLQVPPGCHAGQLWRSPWPLHPLHLPLPPTPYFRSRTASRKRCKATPKAPVIPITQGC